MAIQTRSAAISGGYVVARGGASGPLQINYSEGSDPSINEIFFQQTVQSVSVGCDQIVNVCIAVPSGANGGLGALTGPASIAGEVVDGQLEVAVNDGPANNWRYTTAGPSTAAQPDQWWLLQNLVPGVYENLYMLGDLSTGGYAAQFWIYAPQPVTVVAGPAARVLDSAGDDAFVMTPGYFVGTGLIAEPPAVPGAFSSLAFIANLALQVHGDPGYTVKSGPSPFDATTNTVTTTYQIPLLSPFDLPNNLNAHYFGFQLLNTNPATPDEYRNEDLFIQPGFTTTALNPGTTLEVDQEYCLSEVELDYTATSGTLQAPYAWFEDSFDGIDWRGQSVSYSLFSGYSQAWGTPIATDAPAPTGAIHMALPQGQVTLYPSATLVSDSGAANVVNLAGISFAVGCGQQLTVVPGFALSLDPIAQCAPANGQVAISGSVAGDIAVNHIWYQLNGGAPVDLCSANCGVDPTFSATLALADCGNSITVYATSADVNGTVSAASSVVWVDPGSGVDCGVPACVPSDPCAGVVCPGDACNTNACVLGLCVDTPVVCAAPDACHTAGTCDPNNGCPMATLSPGYCSIGGACVAAGATAPGNPCEVCTPADSTSAYTAVVTTAQPPTIQIANAATSTAGGLPTLPALGGATVLLDASGTSAPGEALSYVWQQSGATAGTTPVLLSQVDSTGAVVSFVAPVLPDDLSGPLTLQFTVTATATLACAAAPASRSQVVAVIIDEPPIAIATVKQTSTCGGFNSQGAVCGGQTVTLDGSSSTDPNGVGIATYTWTQLGSAQTTPVVLSPAQGETVSFTAPTLTTSTTLTFALVVTDKLGLQSVNTNNTVSVTVKAQNETPIADSGSNQTVTQGATVKLSSAGSYDPDGDPITYLWKQTGGPGVCLSGASSACGGGCSNTSTQAYPTFKAPQLSSCGGAKSQVLTFQLVVTDQPTSSQCGGPLASAPSTVTVTVVEPLQPPVANAGSAQTVNDGATVQLDGSQSSDPQGEPLTFKWLQVSGPAATLSNSTAVRPTFIAPPVAGGAIDPLVFQLTVTDTSNLSSSAEVTINDKGLIAPPNCSGAYPSVATLWPPSHEMINVSILGVKDPTDPNVKISITSIEQDEPTTGTCSGDTPIDGVINTDGSCLLRAERGTTNGNRTYYVNFSATDQYGNCCNGQVTVGVPPTSGGSCSPRGAHYNSFQ